MKYAENSQVDYQLTDKIETQDASEFMAFLTQLPAEAPVAWFSHKDDQGHSGAWVRRGFYKLKHQSLVDPSDLSCYAAQVYEASPSGRHECVQIGRSPRADLVPADALGAPTVGALIAAIRTLVPLPADDADDAEGEGAAEEAAVAEEGAELAPVAAAQPAADLKLLQPGYAFEYHGALARGWHAQSYASQADEDGTVETLLVLR